MCKTVITLLNKRSKEVLVLETMENVEEQIDKSYFIQSQLKSLGKKGKWYVTQEDIKFGDDDITID